jgi:3-phosphoshikimate 1-carboxyvinyltransferase
VDFGAQPDLAMPAIIAAALLGRGGTASGLHTLNAKESPRLDATADWLRLLGCSVTQGPDWICWEVSDSAVQPSELELDCLGDHRMAFCAALVSLRFPVRVFGADAVSKSFPDFWEEFRAFR